MKIDDRAWNVAADFAARLADELPSVLDEGPEGKAIVSYWTDCRPCPAPSVVIGNPETGPVMQLRVEVLDGEREANARAALLDQYDTEFAGAYGLPLAEFRAQLAMGVTFDGYEGYWSPSFGVDVVSGLHRHHRERDR